MLHPQAYFSDFAIFYGDVKVMIDTTCKIRISRTVHLSFEWCRCLCSFIYISDITINDEDRFTWTESFKAPLDADKTHYVSSKRNLVVEVDLSSDIHLHITRTKNDEGDYFLGIMITHTDGLSDKTSGVMGEIIHYLFICIWIVVKSL